VVCISRSRQIALIERCHREVQVGGDLARRFKKTASSMCPLNSFSTREVQQLRMRSRALNAAKSGDYAAEFIRKA